LEQDLPVDHGTNDVAKDGLRELLRSRRAVALVGAGVSSWAGYPVWRQLIDRLATFACEYNPDPHAQQEIRAIAGASQDDLLAVAKDLSAFLQPRHFKTFLNRVLGPENCRMHEVIRQICALPFGDILNLNLDPSLEYAHVSLDRICRNYSGVAAGELAAFLKSGDEPGHARHLIYLHGRYSDALDDIALTEDGYNLVYKQGSFVILMTAIAATRRVVFLGFGFEDKRLLAAFESTTSYLGDPTLCHYAIMPFERVENEQQTRTDFRNKWNVELVFYELTPDDPRGPHSGFLDLIAELGVTLDSRYVAEQMLAAPTATPPPANVDELLEAINAPNLEIVRGDGNV
jgi:hypothetical protein